MTTTLVTADDLFAMGSDCRCELVNGVLIPMSPSGYQASYIGLHLAILIGGYVEEHDLGTTTMADGGYRLRRDPDTVRAPDFAFVARGRITPEMDTTRYLELAPDLVVEVISPNDLASEITAKVIEYLDVGVKLVLVVYPKSRTAAVHRPGLSAQFLRASDELSLEDVLPGFSCRVDDLFPRSLQP
jgi:Uma2 family endonuclease